MRPGDRRAEQLVQALQVSAEFAELGDRHEVAVRRSDRKRIVHPAVGIVDVDCETLGTARQDQRLLVLTARPGSDAVGRLELLRVIGQQEFRDAPTPAETP